MTSGTTNYGSMSSSQDVQGAIQTFTNIMKNCDPQTQQSFIQWVNSLGGNNSNLSGTINGKTYTLSASGEQR